MGKLAADKFYQAGVTQGEQYLAGVQSAIQAAEQLLKAQPPATLQTLLSADSPLSFTAKSGLLAQIEQQARIAVEAEAIKQLPPSAQDLIAPRSLLDAALKIKPTR